MLHIQDVLNFEWILIHCGNTDEDTAGCLLVGSQAITEPGNMMISPRLCWKNCLFSTKAFVYLALSAFIWLAAMSGAMAAVSETEKITIRSTLPVDIPKLTYGPNGELSVFLEGGDHSLKEYTVDIYPFHTQLGVEVAVQLESESTEGVKTYGTSTNVKKGQPLKMRINQLVDPNRWAQEVWGELEVRQEGDINDTIPLILGRFGPPVIDGSALSVGPSGSTLLKMDLRKHLEFSGSTEKHPATFELSTFVSSTLHEATVFFRDSDLENPLIKSVQFDPALKQPGHQILRIGTLNLLPGIKYIGYVTTTIGEHVFLPVQLEFTLESWGDDGKFQNVLQTKKGKSPIKYALQAASKQTILGLTVSAISGAKDGFDPLSDLNITLVDDKDVSLWVLNDNDIDTIKLRSIENNKPKLVRISAKESLKPGSYEVTVQFSGLNVKPAERLEVKFILDVPPPIWKYWLACLTLLFAVGFSFLITKGFVADRRRGDLQKRITAIKEKSWLKEDRWGALPIVRAFARISRAGLALSHKHSWVTRISRYVTTPQLIEKEVSQVTTRMDLLKELNQLAIHWKAASTPTDYEGADDHIRVIKRAQKILRKIVWDLSQLDDDQAISSDIIASIQSLKAWQLQKDKLKLGYWKSLKNDIDKLLTVVRIEEFDQTKLTDLSTQLTDILAHQNLAPKVKDALKAAIGSCGETQKNGVIAIREALKDAGEISPAIDSLLNELVKQEMMRKHHHALSVTTSPTQLLEMIELEDHYILLKLLTRHNLENRIGKTLIENMSNKRFKVQDILNAFDQEVWTLLKQNALTIANPGTKVEIYSPVNFRIVCDREDLSQTYLFKHGLQYKWKIDWNEGGQSDESKILRPITRSTSVTQFIPIEGETELTVEASMIKDCIPIDPVKFTTVPTKAFEKLSYSNTPEKIGIVIALFLAFLAGIQSTAFEESLFGGWLAYGLLFLWGIGAEQGKNLMLNLNRFITQPAEPATG